ncbi:protein disulfide oxidoreductase [Aureococcus anophagefferens]|uniref:Protein disulfide oxidoreductase n=1 Tax=Aureococcus anophagefferens TaxID=44056 RepID=A0ABR1GG34_AURAN
MVKLRLALPWQPVLAWPWGVEHVLDVREDEVVVVRHLESWGVSAAGVRQLFRAGPPGPLSRKRRMSAPAERRHAKIRGGLQAVRRETVAGDFDAAAVDASIDAALGNGGVTMYTFTSCPFCKKAKELLDDKGATYRGDRARRSARTARRSGRGSASARAARPCPRSGSATGVGGLNDGAPGLVPLDKAGELDGKLKSARAL